MISGIIAKGVKVVILLIFLLIPNGFIFSNEVFEEVILSNESNRSELGISLNSKTKFGAFILRHYYSGQIELNTDTNFEVQIINNSELVLKKVHINGVSVLASPIYTHFVNGVNNFKFWMSIFNEDDERVNKLKKLVNVNGIDVYVECFDEINNEKKKYSFKVSRENVMRYCNAFDTIFINFIDRIEY